MTLTVSNGILPNDVETLTVTINMPVQKTLTIVSAYGTPNPPIGIYTNDYGTVLTNTVASPDTQGTTQYVCAGWVAVGNSDTNGQSSGTTPNMVMAHTNDTVLTWSWSTNYWLDTATNGCGSPDVADGWQPAGTSVVVTATPCDHHHFVAWSGDTNGCAIVGNQITAPMTSTTCVRMG